MKPYKDYDEFLMKALKQPKAAAAYLNEALKEDDPALFLTAYYNVARAYGVKTLAEKAKVHRVSLKKMFSKRGNPEWKSLCRVLAASHLQIRLSPCP
ncbi:MAG TPA: addiction module antidote protein [Elusimicrobiota bacterium]|jgi:probable addiction module antidote protein|nr:addiction module antidote protein [Elusimicrobiota bacterium]